MLIVMLTLGMRMKRMITLPFLETNVCTSMAAAENSDFGGYMGQVV